MLILHNIKNVKNKKVGSSIGFTFSKEEQETYNLKLGDIIEIFPKKIIDEYPKNAENLKSTGISP